MIATLQVTPNYEKALIGIEDFLFESADHDPYVLEWFHNEHDKVLSFLIQNFTTPAIHPTTGDQSWPFADGRFRLFYKAVVDNQKNSAEVYLIHLIDNQQANLKVYPNNSLPTYDEE